MGGDGRAADCLWILQAERESSSDSSNSDLGEFMDDAEIEDNEEKKSRKLMDRQTDIFIVTDRLYRNKFENRN